MSGMNPYDVCKISNNMSSLRYTFVENELHVERGNSMEMCDFRKRVKAELNVKINDSPNPENGTYYFVFD